MTDLYDASCTYPVRITAYTYSAALAQDANVHVGTCLFSSANSTGGGACCDHVQYCTVHLPGCRGVAASRQAGTSLLLPVHHVLYVHLVDREWQLVGMQCDPSFPGFRAWTTSFTVAAERQNLGNEECGIGGEGGGSNVPGSRICVPHRKAPMYTVHPAAYLCSSL